MTAVAANLIGSFAEARLILVPFEEGARDWLHSDFSDSAQLQRLHKRLTKLQKETGKCKSIWVIGAIRVV